MAPVPLLARGGEVAAHAAHLLGCRFVDVGEVGLHQRLIGHPGRMAGLWRLLDYIGKKEGAWVTRRIDIDRHWIATHPYPGKGLNEQVAVR